MLALVNVCEYAASRGSLGQHVTARDRMGVSQNSQEHLKIFALIWENSISHLWAIEKNNVSGPKEGS